MLLQVAISCRTSALTDSPDPGLLAAFPRLAAVADDAGGHVAVDDAGVADFVVDIFDDGGLKMVAGTKQLC